MWISREASIQAAEDFIKELSYGGLGPSGN
jgi:hypothetical protein